MLRASQFRPFQYGDRAYRAKVNPDSLLDYIEGYTKWHHGVPPSYEEMMAAMRVTSKAMIHRAMQQLVDSGRLRIIPKRARAIEVVPRPKPVMDVSDVEWFRVVRVDGEAQLAPWTDESDR